MLVARRLALALLAAALASAAAGPIRARQGGNPPVAPAGWKTYTDPAFAFSLSYPPDLLPLRDPSPDSVSLVRVRFVDRRLAHGDLASRQPGQFAVTVLHTDEPLRDRQVLESWLRARGWLRAGAKVTPVPLARSDAGLEVIDPAQMAPNEVVYFSAAERVYALTRNGADAAAMQASFRLR